MCFCLYFKNIFEVCEKIRQKQKQKGVFMFRVIVAGSRTILDKERIFSKLDFILQNKNDVEIVSGGQKELIRLLLNMQNTEIFH